MKKKNMLRYIGYGYASLFIFVVAMGHIPMFVNSEGQLLGLFRIELHDDILHLASGIWGTAAAWTSTRATILYFKLFGIMYSLDGVIGLLFGQGYLDGGIFFHGITPLDLSTRIATNAPHIFLGGFAILMGFVVSRRLKHA